VTCKVKQTGKKVKVTCTMKASSKRRHLRWTLKRGGQTVRHGATSARRHRLTLGHLRQGRYVLHVQGQGEGTVIVVN
jgi:hypothetical protein